MKISRQLKFNQLLVAGAQCRARQQVLMNTNGFIDLTPASDHTRQCQMDIDTLLADFHCLYEPVNPQFRAISEQKVKALIVIFDRGRLRFTRPAFAPSEHEAHRDRCDNQQIEKYIVWQVHG